jgi:conjugal transfer pilus assembly protein TraB
MATLPKFLFWENLDPKKRQWLTVGLLVAGALFIVWAILALTEKPHPSAPQPAFGQRKKRVTNVGVMAPGQSVSPEDGWLGNAGKTVDQLKQDRLSDRQKMEEAERTNADLKLRMEKLTQEITGMKLDRAQAVSAVSAQQLASTVQAAPPPYPPRANPQTPAGYPPGQPGLLMETPPIGLMRISFGEQPTKQVTSSQATGPNGSAVKNEVNEARGHKIDTYLPVSFTRSVVLGGLDAPTGGQSQANPLPVLLRMQESAVLPNRFGADVRECFVVGAGYGDISSERAYVRLERLSCVRKNGTAMEVKVRGNVYDETGKLGMKGRLVTKQGQILANALIAGVIGGIGQGFQNQYTTTSTSALGSVTSANQNEAFQAGLSQGVGRAMDRLAQYYISLADKVYPIIEVDAGRLVDVVITEGTVIDPPFDGAGLGRSAATAYPISASTENPQEEVK